jgi:hypothetical protein
MKKRIIEILSNILKLSEKKEGLSMAEKEYKKEIPQETKEIINVLFKKRSAEIRELAKL